jgi:hypothetical protein
VRAKPRRLRCWRACPMLWARPSHMVSSRCRLMDSASLRRGNSRSKSGWPGGIGRRFSVRLSLRVRSSSLPWRRTVMT